MRAFAGIITNLVIVSLTIPAAYAQKEAEADEIEEISRDFELMRHESFFAPGMESLGVDGVEASDGPLKRFAQKWPSDLVIAPVPGYSPQLGWTLKLAGGYFKDSANEEYNSPPSVFGGLAMFSENGSTAFGGGTYLHLLDDKLRVQIGGGYADIKYRYYLNDILGGSTDLGLDIEQEGPLFFTKATWRVWKNLYLGVGYLGGSVETRLRRPPDFLPDLPGNLLPGITLDLGAFIVPFEVDSRDNDQFPREGWKIDGKGMFYRESAGSDFDADIYKFNFNYYIPVRGTDTIASRLVIKSAGDGAPFFLLSSFGGSTDLRGYPSGRYRDRQMYAVQSEYRWQFSERWIFTGFAGFGEVAEKFSDFGSDFLPAAGVGARFVLSKKHKVSLSADIGVGDDGVEFYFGVGEAF